MFNKTEDPELVEMCNKFLADHKAWLEKNGLTEEEYLSDNKDFLFPLSYAWSNSSES